jgi:predicted ABC-type transport system involved in lysophospholipase L1 biosynthesis ATPase subunit
MTHFEGTAHSILSARQVTKTYRTGTHEVPALRGVDLDVAAGAPSRPRSR